LLLRCADRLKAFFFLGVYIIKTDIGGMCMNKARKNMERKGWIAAVAGFTMPGMGQIYNGGLLKGLCFFIISVVTPFTGLWLSTRLTDRCLFMGVITTAVLSLAVYAFAILEAFRNASKQRIE
jgi:TM2 domain-containing membrane protein YozV